MRTPPSRLAFFPACRLLLLGLAVMLFPRIAGASTPGRVLAWGAGDTASTGSGYPHFGQAIVPAAASDDVISLTGGAFFSAALKTNGTVLTWGHNDVGQLAVPAGLGGIVAIASGSESSHLLALKSNGTVAAWGYNTGGQVTGTPTLTSPQIAVANPVILGGQVLSGVVGLATGQSHSVALKTDGTVVAWGANNFGTTAVPAGLSGVIAVAAGSDHTLALKNDGTVLAWGGLNTHGEITVPSTLTGVVAVAAAQSLSVALKSDGTVVAWGYSGYDQTNVPAGLAGVVAIAAGDRHVLALKHDGTIVSWGTGGDGQTTIPPTAQSCVLAIAAGNRHSLALVASPPVVLIPPGDQVRLAGQTASFTVAVGGTPDLTYQWSHDGVPLSDGGQVSGATTAQLTVGNLTAADAGDYTVEVGNCAATITHPVPALLTVNPTVPPGRVLAWGDDSFGQSNVPLAAQSGVVAISAGQGHTLALKANGTLLAWGWNGSGQTDVPLATLNGSVAIAAGQAHSLALRNDGVVLAWGNNAEGQTNVPAGLSGVTAIAAGGSHSVALKNDGTVVAWGHNGFGQSTVPPGLGGVVAISAGMYHTLALKNDGTVLAWGDNSQAQSTVTAGLSDAVAITAGFYHSAALKADGTIVAWGAGTVDTGVNPHRGQSLPPSGLNAGLGIAAGRHHTVALKNDKNIAAWGSDDNGQTTVLPAAQTRALAIAAGWQHTVAIVARSPLIVGGPHTAYVNLGHTVDFTVLVEGTPPLVYQWRRQSAMGSSDIPGATGPALRLTEVQASQAGQYIVVVSNAEGSATGGPVQLTVLPATTFAQWRQTRFTAEELADPAVSGPLADPRGEGLPNLLRYALKLEASAGGPAGPSSAPPGWPLIPVPSPDGRLTLAFQALRTDLAYTVEASTDLVSWSTSGVMVEGNGTARTATVTSPRTGDRLFLRVVVTLQEGP